MLWTIQLIIERWNERKRTMPNSLDLKKKTFLKHLKILKFLRYYKKNTAIDNANNLNMQKSYSKMLLQSDSHENYRQHSLQWLTFASV